MFVCFERRFIPASFAFQKDKPGFKVHGKFEKKVMDI